MKRILFLADVNSSHTQKWVTSLAGNGFQIGLFSLSIPDVNWYGNLPDFIFFDQPGFSSKLFSSSSWQKIGFLKTIPFLKRVINEFKPDIVHAHYASSYGLLGSLTGFHPYFISVWGSDLFEFPQKSFVHKWIVRRNLENADKIFSTSMILEKEVFSISGKSSVVIPFGIDIEKFRPAGNKVQNERNLTVIGAIKSLEKNYCIDVLMKAFAIVKNKRSDKKLRLVIVGSGTEEMNLKSLANRLCINDVTEFKGRIAFDKIPACHNDIDIFANLSAHESFGVSVLEASACAKPVVATNVGGLKEVVIENETGFLVPVNDAEQTALCLLRLIDDNDLALRMGERGRAFVVANYSWDRSLKKMREEYMKVQ